MIYDPAFEPYYADMPLHAPPQPMPTHADIQDYGPEMAATPVVYHEREHAMVQGRPRTINDPTGMEKLLPKRKKQAFTVAEIKEHDQKLRQLQNEHSRFVAESAERGEYVNPNLYEYTAEQEEGAMERQYALLPPSRSHRRSNSAPAQYPEADPYAGYAPAPASPKKKASKRRTPRRERPDPAGYPPQDPYYDPAYGPSYPPPGAYPPPPGAYPPPPGAYPPPPGAYPPGAYPPAGHHGEESGKPKKGLLSKIFKKKSKKDDGSDEESTGTGRHSNHSRHRPPPGYSPHGHPPHGGYPPAPGYGDYPPHGYGDYPPPPRGYDYPPPSSGYGDYPPPPRGGYGDYGPPPPPPGYGAPHGGYGAPPPPPPGYPPAGYPPRGYDGYGYGY
eukprot:NODE_2261_length_1463_cov_66.788060_g2147_i0.p1 GENE.NODE_2261_length_1463_cov_66.788060_g2147_i0~~NODE_2261_length_1463_cov_66.788060_g2147_i0.p1  ORF type:complete len:408 (+),score=95.08 NODE_2261_length_1463_cov_66.788060_g2147_i0:64-1224(+)